MTTKSVECKHGNRADNCGNCEMWGKWGNEKGAQNFLQVGEFHCWGCHGTFRNQDGHMCKMGTTYCTESCGKWYQKSKSEVVGAIPAHNREDIEGIRKKARAERDEEIKKWCSRHWSMNREEEVVINWDKLLSFINSS